MKKLLASASFLILGSAAVSAADLPMKAPPYVAPIPVFSWTGCYIGGHVGAGSSHDSFTGSNENFSDAGNNGATGTGGLAGGQIGCNYQDGNAVFGLEGEGYWSGIKATSSEIDVNSLGQVTRSFTTSAKNTSDFSIAARIGLAFDRTLVYAKGGWVWGRFAFDEIDNFGPGEGINTFHQSGTLDGLLLGVGIEHALTQNWTVKLEYNFLDFGSKNFSNTGCFSLDTPPCRAVDSASQHMQKQVFKVGFNYLFNVWGAPPLVARY
jgi:outer membrane immunogenic protein